jgi:hypothetical protein
MKKTFLFLGLAFILGFNHDVSAQKKETKKDSKNITEGIIIYDLKLEGGEELGMMAAMLPTELTVKFKGSKSRSEFATGMSETVAITDSKDDKAAVALIDMMGNKYAMKIDPAKLAEQKAAMPIYDVMETKEKKVIAGYTCNKAILVNQATKEEVTVFYAPEIPFAENSFNAEFKKINGMPMEYVAKMSNFKMTVTVREVKKDKVDDTAFVIPTEYKVVTQAELMKELGAGGE